jgi:uncharacterized protein YcnI
VGPEFCSGFCLGFGPWWSAPTRLGLSLLSLVLSMDHIFATKLIATCAILVCATPLFAHITLQDGAAAAGANYRATLRVGHGCDGSVTTGIRVTIPAGFNGAQPMPKPGWTLATKPGPLWFKVVQTCEKGANAWLEIPAQATSTKGLKSPAALLQVLDVQASGGHAH